MGRNLFLYKKSQEFTHRGADLLSHDDKLRFKFKSLKRSNKPVMVCDHQLVEAILMSTF